MHQRRGEGEWGNEDCKDGDDDEKDSFVNGRKRRKYPWYMRFFNHSAFKAIPLSIAISIPIGMIFFALPELFHQLQFSRHACVLHLLFACWLSVMFIYNFAATMFTAPGSLSESMHPHDATTGQYMVTVPDRFQTGILNNAHFAARYCNQCENWKPPRAHHCSTCNQCTLRMDHHCPFMVNCVGARNHAHFLLMYVFAHTGMIYALILSGWCYWVSPESHVKSEVVDESFPHMQHLAAGPVAYFTMHILNAVLMKAGMVVAVTVLVACGALIFIYVCGCPAMYIALKNSTLLEYYLYSQSEYVQIDENVFCPLGSKFFSEPLISGIFTRTPFHGLLGARGCWRFLLPIPGKVDMRALCIEPVASERGCKQLLAQIESMKTGETELVETLADLGLGRPRNSQNNII